MNTEFVPYIESLELKQIGFDELCYGWYDGEYKDIINYDRTRNSCGWLNDISCSSPTFSQCFRFFREKHNLFSSEVYDRGLNNGKIPIIHSYSFRILNLNNFEDFYGNVFKTYEEAELACLRKLISIIKNK